MREAYQSKNIGQRILTTNFRVHLNPNFRESGLLQQQQQGRLIEHFSDIRLTDVQHLSQIIE